MALRSEQLPPRRNTNIPRVALNQDSQPRAEVAEWLLLAPRLPGHPQETKGDIGHLPLASVVGGAAHVIGNPPKLERE